MDLSAAPKWHAMLSTDYRRAGAVDFRLYRSQGQAVQLVHPLKLETIDPYSIPDVPPLFQSNLMLGKGLGDELESFLRAIVEVAAEHGIHASGTKSGSKELDATRRHLEDMRQLALGDRYRPT